MVGFEQHSDECLVALENKHFVACIDTLIVFEVDIRREEVYIPLIRHEVGSDHEHQILICLLGTESDSFLVDLAEI